MTEKKENKRDKYDKKMKSLGFKKIHPWVHKDDAPQVLKDIEKQREERLKKLD